MELLEKIKTMETSAVHTPVLPWDASRTASAPAAVQREAVPEAPPAAKVQENRPQNPVPPASGGVHSFWERFVAFVISRDPASGSVLEHGSPIRQEPGLMEIGFPSGSYYLSSLQDNESISAVQGLAKEFTGTDTKVRIVSIEPETGSAPLSLAEKKKSDEQQLKEELRHEVASHPVINEAIRIFGGTITDIQKI
jgi:DNA polymerase-3 subunit gamma/tau